MLAINRVTPRVVGSFFVFLFDLFIFSVSNCFLFNQSFGSQLQLTSPYSSMATGTPYFQNHAMSGLLSQMNGLMRPTPVEYLPPAPVNPTFPGLQSLYNTCQQLYPNQPNPLQVTAVQKFWLGGPDPLDYISMYNNPGDPQKGIPAHWHYISFGLSDLFGDGRVHE